MRIVLELKGDWTKEQAFKLRDEIRKKAETLMPKPTVAGGEVTAMASGPKDPITISVLGDDGMPEDEPVAADPS